MKRQDMLTHIQASKKDHSFDDFLLDIVSWYPLVLGKNSGLISLYPETERSCPVVPHASFVSDIDTLTQTGLSYDTTQSFFENFKTLYHQTPFSAVYNYSGVENSEFAFSVLNSKNCYLSFTVISDCEDIFYSFAIKQGCKRVFNSMQVSNHAQDIYQSLCIVHSSRIFYSKYIENSSNLWFCSNMIGCQECLFCDSMQNASYCIRNEQYTKEEYVIKKAEILAEKEQFHNRYLTHVQARGANHGSSKTQQCEFVTNSENVENGNYCQYLRQAKNVCVVGSPEENEYMYDAFEAGAHGNKHFYGVLNTGVHSEHVYNCEGIVTCMYVFYSRFLEHCSYCRGCIGLKNKQYCILNKQYTKEERFERIEQISASMSEEGTLGNYFPHTLNPFYFNDTIAHMLGDFTKEEIKEKGFLRREEKISIDIPDGAEIITIDELHTYTSPQTPLLKEEVSFLPSRRDGGRWLDPFILTKIIKDASGNPYRIMETELKFLEQYNLPIPHVHWLERMKCNLQ